MHRAVPALIALVLVACDASFAAPSASESTARPTPLFALGEGPQSATTEALVVDVVDGDTIKVAIDGEAFSVRYIGIDAPERREPGAKPATRANRDLVDGQTVLLETDVNDTDRFDRLLRYVWITEGGTYLLVNLELVRLGAAVAKSYPPDTSYQALLKSAQLEAKSAAVGLWDTPDTIVPLVPPLATPKPDGGGCDPSYPGVCIPPYPPDLDCGDITFRRFEVKQPDPHGFDADLDGIGCETG